MARLPSRFDLSGPDSLRSGRQISSADTTAIGRGLQSLGGAIGQAGQVAADIAAREKQKQTVLGLAQANADQAAGNIALGNEFENDTDYATFGKRAEEKARKIAAEAAKHIADPEARELWSIQANTDAKAAADRIHDQGIALKQQAGQVALKDTLQIQRDIYADPRTTEAQKAKARASIEATLEVAKGSGLLQPAQYDQYKETFLHGGDFERAKLDTNIGAPADAANVVRGFEGFRETPYWDVNAYRVGYGSDTITREDGSVVRVKPGMTVSRADAERDLARRLGDFQSGIAEKIGKSRWDSLPSGAKAALSSVTYNYGELPDSVAKAARTGDPEAIAQAVEGLATDNNGVNADRRASEAAMVRGGADEPAYFANLHPDERQTVLDMRASERAQAITAQNAQAKIDYTQAKDSMELGILTGDVVSEQQILSSQLNDGDKATMLRSFRAEQGATADARDLVANPRQMNPYSADDKTLVDKAYGELVKSMPDGQLGAATREFVKSTGVVPKAVIADVRQALSASDPTTVAAGLNQAALLNEVAPTGLKGAESADSIADAARKYRYMTDSLGLTPEQAAQRYIAMNDPEQATKREALLKTKKVKEFVDKKIDAQMVSEAFSTPGAIPFTSNVPKLGETPFAEAAAVADFKGLFEESLVDMNGDMDAARTLANQRMSLRYGASPLTLAGDGVVTFLPPEKTYPVGKDGTHNYVAGQARDALAAEGIDAKEVWLQTYDETERTWEAGQPALYQLHYRDADGMMQMYNLPFYADPANSAPYAFQQNREARDENKAFMQYLETATDPLKAPAFGPGIMDMGSP